jgi:hypothetical protein
MIFKGWPRKFGATFQVADKQHSKTRQGWHNATEIEIAETVNRRRKTMSQEMMIENATKAAQGADLLLQDLQGLLRDSDAVVAMLVLPEIEKVAGVKQRMEALASAIKSKD